MEIEGNRFGDVRQSTEANLKIKKYVVRLIKMPYLVDKRAYFSEAIQPQTKRASAAFNVSFSASGCNTGTPRSDNRIK
jgi:hypothetical protein